ncbi:hypothetical protein FACS189443_3730 [Planctomycetales bacterium]|nr:hypothetical protein FACS189443_3730 [Planctomycetales bacterium]
MNTNANTITFGGDITGSGGIEKTGAGILTLGGTNNNYSGNTLVSEGTLKGDTSSLQMNIINNANVEFAQTTAGTYAGIISGTGNLTKTGGTLNFYVPSAMGSSKTMLNVTGNANIDGSTVNVHLDGGSSPLKMGNQIKLIETTGTLTGVPTSTTSDKWSQGVTFQYEFDITTDSSNKQLLATVTAADINPQTKSFSEARLSQLAFANQGSDLVAGQGLFAALDATTARRMQGTNVFGAISGGSSRYKTGSHNDVTGVSLITVLPEIPGWRTEN